MRLFDITHQYITNPSIISRKGPSRFSEEASTIAAMTFDIIRPEPIASALGAEIGGVDRTQDLAGDVPF